MLRQRDTSPLKDEVLERGGREMADEQPGHIARGVRDVSKVPLAKELVKNNVGSTVKNQEHGSTFVIVSQV